MVKSNGISEKTLEINICSNLLERIRRNQAYRKAYWHGISMRLERKIGLDVELEPGMGNPHLLLGLQFKKPRDKNYDYRLGKYYYVFKINNNSANDQHIILWLISSLLHAYAINKFVLIGYAFPKFISNRELYSSSPNFLNRTVFVDAIAFPPAILDRLEHEVHVYDGIYRVTVHSKKYEINPEYIMDGENLLEKLSKLEKDHLLRIDRVKYTVGRRELEKALKELNEELREDVIKYVNMKIDKGWRITLRTLMI